MRKIYYAHMLLFDEVSLVYTSNCNAYMSTQNQFDNNTIFCSNAEGWDLILNILKYVVTKQLTFLNAEFICLRRYGRRNFFISLVSLHF